MTGLNIGSQLGAAESSHGSRRDVVRRCLALIISSVVVILAEGSGGGATAWEQAWLLLVGFLGLLLGVWNRRSGAGGSAFLYFVIFALFHGGLVFAYAVRGDAALLGAGDNSWIVPSELAPAVRMAVIGAGAATVGAVLAQLRRPPSFTKMLRDEGVGRLPLVAGSAVIVGTLLVARSILGNGGLSGGTGYIEFLELVAGDGAFSYGALLLGLGLALLVAAGGKSRIVGWVGLGILSVGALPLGLRGPVLFPLVTMVIIEAKRRPLKLWVFALVSVGVLAAISVIRQTRTQGVSGLLAGGWTRIDPLDGAAEMGYSLYPVVQVDRWMSGGTEPMNGVTFVAPIVRLAERLLGIPSPPGDQDLRLFNIEIFTRVGPIGGSPIAEGYRNFGAFGVVLVLFLLGYLLTRIDLLPGNPAGAALAAVVVLPIVTAVRNSFAPVLPQIAIGLVLVILAFVGRRPEERVLR